MMQRITWISLLFIILIGFALRIHYLDRPMRLDESTTTYIFASKDIPSIVADYNAPNNHIFHTLFVHLAYQYIDQRPFFLRWPAFIAGMLLIPLTFVTASRLYNRDVALLAAGLVAVAPVLVDFSVNARGYTMLTAIMLMLWWLAGRVQYDNSTFKWLAFGGLSALGFFTIPIMLYPMGGVAIWLLLSLWYRDPGYRRRELLKNYTVALLLGALLTVILYIPVIMFTGADSLFNNVNIQALSPAEFYPMLPAFLNEMQGFIHWGMPLPLVLGIGGAFVLGIFLHGRLSGDKFSIALPVLAWVGALILIQRVDPYPRTWLFLIPVYLMVASAGFVVLTQRFLTSLHIHMLTLLLCLGMGFHIVQSRNIETSVFTLFAPDAEEAALYLNDLLDEDDAIIMTYPSSYTVLYYMRLHRAVDEEEADEDSSGGALTLDTADKIYLYHQNYDWEREELQGYYPDLMAKSEIIREFPFSVLYEVVEEDEP